jgi:hypothetical protein
MRRAGFEPERVASTTGAHQLSQRCHFCSSMNSAVGMHVAELLTALMGSSSAWPASGDYYSLDWFVPILLISLAIYMFPFIFSRYVFFPSCWQHEYRIHLFILSSHGLGKHTDLTDENVSWAELYTRNTIGKKSDRPDQTNETKKRRNFCLFAGWKLQFESSYGRNFFLVFRLFS